VANSEDKPIEEQNKVNRPIEDQDKIILKRYELPGVDMSVTDFEMLSTVKVSVTHVTKKMYKSSGQTFIGIKEQLDKGDVIQAGNMEIKYKVIKLVKVTDREGRIYRVKRIDGGHTTQLDLDNIAVGQKVRVVNRKTFEQLMNYACSMYEENPIEPTVDPDDADACETPSVPATVQGESLPLPPCTQYQINVPAGLGLRSTRYRNCDNVVIDTEHNDSKATLAVTICAREIIAHIGFEPVSVIEVGEC
jgi:hypothetical protein